jgi:undecaprenyl diphosphate synthase
VRRAVEAAPSLGIATLSLFAFSADNWKRPPAEVTSLLELFAEFLAAEVPALVEHGVRLAVIGRRDRLPPALRGAIEGAEAATAAGARLHLRLAIDYSARDAIARAGAGRADGEDRAAFARRLGAATGGGEALDVDLLIRTGGERRLSDFLLWECAYAELVFLPRMWPDFDGDDLAAALAEFHRRERRFGGLPPAAALAG